MATAPNQPDAPALVTNIADIRALQARLQAAGYRLTPVRILEVLVWLSTEPRGHYGA